MLVRIWSNRISYTLLWRAYISTLEKNLPVSKGTMSPPSDPSVPPPFTQGIYVREALSEHKDIGTKTLMAVLFMIMETT